MAGFGMQHVRTPWGKEWWCDIQGGNDKEPAMSEESQDDGFGLSRRIGLELYDM